MASPRKDMSHSTKEITGHHAWPILKYVNLTPYVSSHTLGHLVGWKPCGACKKMTLQFCRQAINKTDDLERPKIITKLINYRVSPPPLYPHFHATLQLQGCEA